VVGLTFVASKKEISQAEAARILGIQPNLMIGLEARGHLKGKRIGRRVFYSRREVEEYKSCRPLPEKRKRDLFGGRIEREIKGAKAAEVFEMIAAGNSLSQIVLETKMSPVLVHVLWEYYSLGFDGIARAKREAAEERATKEQLSEANKMMNRDRWMRFQLRMKQLGPPTRPDLVEKRRLQLEAKAKKTDAPTAQVTPEKSSPTP
jgi:hypothetical protein